MTTVFDFSFAGKIRRPAYALASLATFFSQHVIVLAVFQALARPLTIDGWFWVVPLRSLARLEHVSALILVAALGYLLLSAWVLAALAFRRAAHSRANEWIAASAIAPLVQIPVLSYLCNFPSRHTAAPS